MTCRSCQIYVYVWFLARINCTSGLHANCQKHGYTNSGRDTEAREFPYGLWKTVIAAHGTVSDCVRVLTTCTCLWVNRHIYGRSLSVCVCVCVRERLVGWGSLGSSAWWDKLSEGAMRVLFTPETKQNNSSGVTHDHTLARHSRTGSNLAVPPDPPTHPLSGHYHSTV